MKATRFAGIAFLAALAAAPAAAQRDSAPAVRRASAPRAGEDAEYAKRMGWPVQGPRALAGALLPSKRIVCYYGNPASRRMGILGEVPKPEMLRRLRAEVSRWNAADPAHPAVPCLHMVATVAQAERGTSGHYRAIVRDSTVRMVHGWAREAGGVFFVDLQIGTDNLRNVLPRFEWILRQPDVHLGLDPEFSMKTGARPGTRIGSMSAADINYATEYLAGLVRRHSLPPKVVVVHRFTRAMVTGASSIRLRPETQIVMDMDGWGPPQLKRDSYRAFIVREPVQYAGFKLFYKNDTKAGHPLMTPRDLLRLEPKPLYIQYQ